MKIKAITLLIITLCCIRIVSGKQDVISPEQTPQVNEATLMKGKVKTGRTIALDVIVQAPPSEVFELWTTVDGVKKFFAPDAKIDPVVGGRYQIIFLPAKDPEGESLGTKGARVLKFVRNNELAFEWITFAGNEYGGENAPPYAPPAERNTVPLPTWVEISFKPIEGQSNKTHVKFAHYGFKQGERWEKSYQWFSRVWARVLGELETYCQRRNSTLKAQKEQMGLSNEIPRIIVRLEQAAGAKETR